MRVWTPLARNLNPGDGGVPRLAGPNVGLLNPDYHHPQLLELCELNQKRWESLTIPNQAPSGGLGELKKGAKRLGPRRPGANVGSRRADSKGNTAQQYYPQLRPFDLRPPQKTNPQRSWGTVLPPTSGAGVTSGFEVQTSMRSREAWTEPKKRWRDGTAGIADRAIAEPGSTGAPQPKS